MIKLATWSQKINFIITKKKKPQQKVIQEKMFEYNEYDHDFYVTNLEVNANKSVDFYEKI